MQHLLEKVQKHPRSQWSHETARRLLQKRQRQKPATATATTAATAGGHQQAVDSDHGPGVHSQGQQQRHLPHRGEDHSEAEAGAQCRHARLPATHQVHLPDQLGLLALPRVCLHHLLLNLIPVLNLLPQCGRRGAPRQAAGSGGRDGPLVCRQSGVPRAAAAGHLRAAGGAPGQAAQTVRPAPRRAAAAGRPPAQRAPARDQPRPRPRPRPGPPHTLA